MPIQHFLSLVGKKAVDLNTPAELTVEPGRASIILFFNRAEGHERLSKLLIGMDFHRIDPRDIPDSIRSQLSGKSYEFLSHTPHRFSVEFSGPSIEIPFTNMISLNVAEKEELREKVAGVLMLLKKKGFEVTRKPGEHERYEINHY